MITKLGVTVKILFDKYNKQLEGKIGTVERLYDYGKVGVKIEGCCNYRSSYGVYWFDEEDVEIYNGKEEQFIMLNNFKVAMVAFLSGTNTDSTYPYALYDDDLKPGDTVVVQTGHHGLSIAKIIEVNPPGVKQKSVRYGREIIAKVDFTAYEERQEKRERLIKLKNQMDAKVHELQKNAIYEMFAEKDPAMKQMLDEYKELMN